MSIKQRLRVLFKHQFVSNVSVLVGGTAFSQILVLLALPFVTRLYTPEDFTVLASYTSILVLLSVIACLRFEIAIPIPKDKKEGIQLFVLSTLSVVGVTLFTCLLIFFFSTIINDLTNDRLANYLWLLPVGVFFSGIYNALQYWITREKAFPLIAKTRMTQAVSGTVAQLSFGYAGVTPFGLLLGQLLSVSVGGYGLLLHLLKRNRKLFSSVSFKSLGETFKRYDRFPKYSTWEALTNSAGIEIPILIIATLAMGPEAGYIMLATRLLSAPMGLVSSSIAQAYLAEAAEKYHKGELKKFTLKLVFILAKIGFLPLLFAGVISPFVIPFAFGDEWQRAGVLISWMAPWFFLQFITSPISMVLHITDNQKIALLLQVSGLIVRGGLVWYAALNYNSLVGEFYAISGFIFYSIYLLVVLSVLKRDTYKMYRN